MARRFPPPPRRSLLSRIGLGKAFFWESTAADAPTIPLPGSNLNWEKDAGTLWRNSTVAVCLNWLTDTFPEAPLLVQRTLSDGTKKPLPDHPLTLLLRQPGGVGRQGGAAIPGSAFWSATLLSLLIEGNAYWVLRRSTAGRIVAVEYVPHWMIEPKWQPGEFLSDYAYTPGSGAKPLRLAVTDVIHFRKGLDPENTRKGLSALKAVVREIVSDNEATSYTALILKNMGVPGAVITPPKDAVLAPGFIERVKMLWREVTSGNRRGDPVVFKDAVTIQNLGFSPEQLALDKIRAIPQATICAALRVPPMVVGLSVGDSQRTYANMREAREMVEESTLIPLYVLLAETINVQLLPQLSNRPDEAAVFDLSQVRVLQQDRDALYTRVAKAFQMNLLTRAEARTELGFAPEAGRDDVFFADTRPVSAASAGGESPATIGKALEEEARRVLYAAAKDRRLDAERSGPPEVAPGAFQSRPSEILPSRNGCG